MYQDGVFTVQHYNAHEHLLSNIITYLIWGDIAECCYQTVTGT